MVPMLVVIFFFSTMGANGDVLLLLKMRGEMQDPVRRDAVRSND